jgi:hypothetical protein
MDCRRQQAMRQGIIRRTPPTQALTGRGVAVARDQARESAEQAFGSLAGWEALDRGSPVCQKIPSLAVRDWK